MSIALRRTAWNSSLIGLGLGLGLGLAGCENASQSKLNTTTAAKPTAGTAEAPGNSETGATAEAPPAQPGADDAISGTVVETMGAAGYTYARLEHGGTSVWVAGPETKLVVGMKVGAMAGQAMPGFHSDSLNRTFDQIYFVNTYNVAAGAAAAASAADGKPGMTATADHAPSGGGDEVSGVVTETMNAGGYTYAKLDHAGKTVWVAGPETKLAPGAKIGTVKGTAMPGFHSDTLNRTFDQIYFITGFAIEGAAPPSPHAPVNEAPAIAAATTVPVESIAPVAGGTTVATVYANRDALNGKPVVLHAKVVKINNGILDRNWVHLRDGSGAAGTNDLLITTSAVAKVGDVVVARGTVATHKDFGANYRYDVVVENATLSEK